MASKQKAKHSPSSPSSKAVRQPTQASESPPEAAPAGTDPPPSKREGDGRGPPSPVVSIGASAGGLEALTEFLRAMPADSGLAFVVVSHLDPEHKSALGDILARLTSMPVHEVEDGMAVEPNHVYIIPPNRDMIIVQNVLHLAPRAETRGPHTPVDTFLSSLAQDRGSQASGVILSGTGSDGTWGLKAIKAEGGITFAQDQTARFGGMPQSAVAAGCVDYVLPPPLIAAELVRIARHPSQSRPAEARPLAAAEKEDAFLQILRLLSATTGVDFLNYKHSTLRRRIERRLVLRRLSTLDEYLQCLREDPGERQKLFEEVLIPVTGFFRDPQVFEALKNTVFPRLLQNRPPGAPLRVWVPGCASGEEAYSLAICLLEYTGNVANAVPIKVFATDISDRAIEAARAGVYGEGILAEVSAERLQQFFVKTSRGYEISRAVRDLCIFARQDVTKDPPFSQLDLVSCRNVLIYLGLVLQSQVLPIFHYALKPGGFLVLGNSETVGTFTDIFEVADKRYKFYVRTATPSRLTFDYTPGTPPRTQVVVREAGTPLDRGTPNLYREVDRLVLAHYAPPGVVVDENLRVLQFRGDTGNYLKPAPGPPTADLLLMARDGLLGDLRTVLDRAKRDNAPARQEGVRVKSNDHFREINLVVIPNADPASETHCYAVMFEEARPAAEAVATPTPRVPVAPEEESAKDREIGLLKRELGTTKAYLPIHHRTERGRQRRAASRQ